MQRTVIVRSKTPATRAVIETLAAKLGRLLKRRRMTVTTAESCTGGLVAGAITSTSGSSDWFGEGFVTYSNDAKRASLGVTSRLLAAHGAVSEPVAEAMVQGALKRTIADVAVAITGIAGPTGGSPEKPVGTVWFAWGERDGAIRTLRCHFDGNRRAVRDQSVAVALKGLIRMVKSSSPSRRANG